MQYTQQISRSKPQLIEESKLWEKYTHHVLRSTYDLMSIGEEEEPLYSYLVKAQKIQDMYSDYNSSRNATLEQEMLESIIASDSEDKEQQLKQLTFPFDQVSEGFFLAYFLEAFAGLKRGLYSNRLKKDVSYRIQYVKNIEFLLNVISKDFKLDLTKHGIDGEALTNYNYEAANNLFWLLFSKIKLEKVNYKGHREEEGLLHWAMECVSRYPGVNISELQFEDGFMDGMTFCYIYHYYNTESIDLSRVLKEHPDENLKQAFDAGWKYCIIPQIIQNHNINRRSSIIYLYMMYEALQDKARATFGSNQLSRIIRRKLEYEKLKNFYTDRAKTLLEDLRGMEEDIKDIQPNEYLSNSRIEDIKVQLLSDYKTDKAGLLYDFMNVHNDSFNLICLTHAENRFRPFDPPGQLTLTNLYKVFDALTPKEKNYVGTLHNLQGVHSVVTDMVEDYTQTVSLIKAFTEEISNKLIYLDVGNRMESHQHAHSIVGDILADLGQNKALLRIVEFIDTYLMKKKITPTPAFEDVLTMWNDVYQQAETTYGKLEHQMELQMEAEIMKLEYSFMTESTALTISNAIWLLQAPYIGPEIARKLFAALDTFIDDKSKHLEMLSEYEQKVVGRGQDVDISRIQLANFLQDLVTLRTVKEEDMQELLRASDLRERIESNANQVTKFVIEVATFLESLTTSPLQSTLNLEPEDIVSKKMDRLKIFEKEKSQHTNTYNSFVASYTDYKSYYENSDSFRYTDQVMQMIWNKMIEAFKAQKNSMEKMERNMEQLPTIRLTQQSEIHSLNQILSQYKRDNSLKSMKLNESTVKVLEENLQSRINDIQEIVSRHFSIALPSCLSPQVRKENILNFSSIMESFIQFIDGTLKRWNRFTLDIANLVDVNKKRLTTLQQALSHSIQEASVKIPTLKSIDEVLEEAKIYSQDSIILDQIEFLDEILLGSSTEEENEERRNQILIVKGQWETLWDLIRSQVQKLIEGEGNVICPDIDFLNEKFKRTLEKLKAKSASLDEEYKHKYWNLTKILKTISEIHADAHHARIFYELYLQQILTLSEDERERYNISGFDALQKWIVQIRKEVEKDVLAAFAYEERKARYSQIAKSMFESIFSQIEELTDISPTFNIANINGIEALCNKIDNAILIHYENLEELKKLSDTFQGQQDRPDVGDKSLDFLSSVLQVLQDLQKRVRDSSSLTEERLMYIQDLKTWIKEHVNSIQEWIQIVENSVGMTEKISSVDDIFLSRRLLQHHLQESTFIHHQIRDIGVKISNLEREDEEMTLGDTDLVHVKDSWSLLIPRLQQALNSVESLDQNYVTRNTFKSQLQMDIIRIGSFIEIVKAKNIERPVNFVGRVSMGLLETYIEDCIILQTTIENLPDLSKIQLETSDLHPFLIPLDREIEEMKYDYKQIRNRFEFILSETMHKLQGFMKSEKEIHILHKDFNRLAGPLLNTIVSAEGQFDINHNDIIQELSPSFETVKRIHNNCSTKIIEGVPFEILQSKWKRLCRMFKSNGMRGDINIDNQKRKQELKRLILESSRQVSSWIDNALQTLQQISNLPVSKSLNLQHAQKLLNEIKILNIEEESSQYGKLIQVLNQYTELVLFCDEDFSDIESIIKSIERKWVMWMLDSKTMIDKLGSIIEELQIHDYQKKNFHHMSVGIIEWISIVTNELNQINGAINDATQLRVQSYHLTHWMKQKQAKLEIVKELQDICQTMKVPDQELLKNMQEINICWTKMEQLAAEKQSMLSQISSKLEEVDTVNRTILSKHEEIIKWISFERDQLINALISNSSTVIQEALDNAKYRIKAEAIPILEYLQSQRNFVHKHLLDNHWNTFLFLYNRAKKRSEDLQQKEQRQNIKLETYQSKLELYFESLSQLLDAVASIVDCSSNATTKEMESALDDLIDVYGSMESIVAEYVSLLAKLDSDGVMFVDYEISHRFEKYCTECFTKFDELFRKYSEDYETKMKTESISATYFAIFQAISGWIDVQKQIFEALDGETLQISSISSRHAFYKDYFTQRQQISLLYHQLSDVWGILSNVGVVLEIQVPTPADLKSMIENLDESMNSHLSRIDDLISQFEYVLSLRQQFIETACNVSQFSQDAMFQLIGSPVITAEGFRQVKAQVDALRKKDRNTTSVLSFLEELTQTILDECVLLPANWDPQLKIIVFTLKKNRDMFERLLVSKEKFLEKFEPKLAELTSAENTMKEMSTALLSYSSEALQYLQSFLNDTKLSRIDRFNLMHKYVNSHNAKTKYLLRLLDVVSKVKHANWISATDEAVIRDVWNEILSDWKDVSRMLDQCLQRISFLGDGIPLMKDSSDIQLFLEILYLNIWISDSCIDLQALLDHDLRREDISDILFDINIFTREMEENQVVLRRVVEVDPESEEIQTLRNSWSKLQDLFSKSILKLTDHVMLKFHFEHDRGRVLSIHKALSQFLEENTNFSNPVYLTQEYNFYFVKMIPTHYENNLTLRNLFTNREIRALQEDFESMKKPFIDNMSTEDNQEQQLEKMRKISTDTLNELLTITVQFTEIDHHVLTEDYEQISHNIEVTLNVLSNSITERISPLTRFAQSLDEAFACVHSTLLNFITFYIQALTSYGNMLRETTTSVLEQEAKLQAFQKKYEQKIETIFERIVRFEELLEKYDDEEDISSSINIVSRNINPTSSFIPRADIASKFLDKLGVSPDEMQKHFDILQTLKFEIESMSTVMSELFALYLEKISATTIPNASLNNSSIESIYSRWESVVNSVNVRIANLPIIDLEKSTRFIDVDYKELKKWFQDALQFFKSCEENNEKNQLHDFQWTYLGTRMFKIRKDAMEDRYNRFVSVLTPCDSSELMLAELNDKKEAVEDKMNELPDEQELLEKIAIALKFEHQQLKYGQIIEEASKWQDEFSRDLENVQELIIRLRSSTTSLENLESKFSEIEKGKILLSIYKERITKMDTLFTSCDNLYIDLKQHHLYSDLFFTDLEPDMIFDKEDEQKNTLKKLFDEIESIEQEYQEKLNRGLEFISQYNDLVKWCQQSLGLFNKSIALDSPAMVEYARSRVREWNLEYQDAWSENHDSILQTLSMQNHTLVFYIAYCVKYFAILSVNDFKKIWTNMLQLQKSRDSGLEKIRVHLDEVDNRYHLPVEIVDPIISTFLHFAHYNMKSSAIGVLHEHMLSDFLAVLGIEVANNQGYQKEITLCMSYSSDKSQSLSLDDLMMYLSKHHLMIAREAKDLLLIFKRIERNQGLITWEKLVSIIGTALNREQIQLLYTLIRFNGKGIDYNRLAEDMFA